MTGQPFEYEAADSMGYHGEALWMVDLFNAGEIKYYFLTYLKGWSDAGFPLFLFPFYYLFGDNVIIPRVVNAILGALTVLLVYRLTKRNFGESTAKIAAIFCMLMPSLVFYCGLHLKEVVMTFLLVFFTERADYFISVKYPKNMVIFFEAILLLIGICCFRTILAVIGISSMFLNIFFTSKGKLSSYKRIVFLSLTLLSVGYVFSEKIQSEVVVNYHEQTTNIQRRMVHYAQKEGGNDLAKYGKFSVFAPIVLMAPFPTMVDTDQDKFSMLNGALFVRNIMAFFVVVALLVLFKKKLLRKHVILIAILFLYLFVVAKSGFALSERFHYPILPFILIFAAYGVATFKQNYMKYYNLYLCLIFLLIVGWNIFKLAGRGLV